ncbi:hypothetical protein SFC76_12210 [Sphingomonas sp. CD22]|uniref:hypothetical protein n=1 Tax=Sphingomonas sp. CD22 TaxID=3100214 RepID=UPI002ADFE4C7|nr:hypothetical protein [Sphingomonas sp. CD22]MEA1085025.1 hypothetical protein [Sphingomonas sp. CD22]
MAVAWRNLSGDLAEARRKTRTIFVVSIGLIILWLLGSVIVGRATGEFALSRIASAAGLSMGSSTIAALLFGLRHPEVFPHPPDGVSAGPPTLPAPRSPNHSPPASNMVRRGR